tara:strand:+ start:1647 stop:2135 length:489 start_codon:yes stop_codon:yes gene_type:complete
VAKRTERAEAKGSLATDLAIAGAIVGSPLGPVGSVVGGVTGGVAGLIIGDQTTIFPMDMIAIPAFQAYLIQGTPSFQIFIKEGEVLTQVMMTDAQQAETSLVASAPKKRRKPNAWIKFSKSFQYRARRKNESAPAYLSARAKAASRAYKKLNKPTKKGGKKK